MLASSFTDPVLGIDIHFEMVPTPAPVPTPIPNPFTGIVFDPVGLAVGLAIGAAVSAVMGAPVLGPVMYWTAFPATNTGTEAKHVPGHILIPPGVAWAPFPKTPKPVIHPGETPKPALPIKPEDDAVVVFGSKTVTVMGSNAVRLGDLAMSCAEPVRLPSSVVLAVPKGAPILIGGPPSLDLMAAFMASLRTRFVSDSLHAALSRLKPSRFRNLLHRGVCFLTGHPVDVASGKVLTEFVDLELPGPLPLKIERIYSSAFCARPGLLGHGWSLSVDQAVWRERGRLVLRAEDGREIEFDTFDLADRRLKEGQSIENPVERITLRAESGGRFRVTSHDGQVRTFAPVAGRGDGRAMLQQIIARGDHHAVSFTYDGKGQLAEIRDSGGRTLRLVLDAAGRLAQLHVPQSSGDGLQCHRRYEYDAAGDLVTVTDSLGHAWTFEYVTHLLVRETNRRGVSYYFQYDGLGEDAWCTRTWGDGGVFDHVLSYDKPGRITYVTDSTGQVTQYHMNIVGQVIKKVDPLGAQTHHEYDPRTLRRIAQVDALGKRSHLVLDGAGNVVEKHAVDGTVERNRFDRDHNIVQSVDRIGGTTRYGYDHDGRMLQELRPDGGTHRYRYIEGLLVGIDRPDGRSTELRYDGARNIVAVTTRGRGAYTLSHDRLGRITTVIGPDGQREERTFDREGRLVRSNRSSVGIVEHVVDPEGNLIETRNRGRTIRMRYGPANRMIEREEAGARVGFEYDTEDRLTAIVNELGEREEIERDERGDPKQISTFDGRALGYVRDPLARIIAMTDTEGNRSEFGYDDDSRLVRAEHPGDAIERFVYRADGALLEAANEDVTVRMERDAVGRLIREQSGDDWVAFDRSPSGLQRVQTSRGVAVEYSRDDSGRTSQLAVSNSGRHDTWPIRFLCEANGVRTTQWGTAVRQQWTSDPSGRPTSRTCSSAAGWTTQRTWDWHGARLVALEADGEGRTELRHDPRGRLVQTRAANCEPLVRRLDAAGNVQPPGSKHGPGGRLLRTEAATYEYDAEGRMTRKDEAGSVTRYEWNGAGRLCAVEVPDGTRITFRYDPFGRRISKDVTRAGERTQRTSWVWGESHKLHELREGSPDVTWIPGDELAAPLAQLRGKERYAQLADHLGSPTELVDEGGNVVWQARIDMFGRACEERGTTPNWLRFPGQYHDPETGLHYNRWRYYDPQIGAYLRPDPSGLSGGLAYYAYVADPATAFDPFGLEECGLKKGESLPDDAVVHRIGGGSAGNLVPKAGELKLDPPGISSTRVPTPADAAALGREVLPAKWADLRAQLSTMGTATAEDIRAAGFDVIHDPTKLWGDAHARIIHPDGVAGWTEESIGKLAGAFTDTTGL